MIWIIGSIVGLILVGMVGSSSSGSRTKSEPSQTDIQSTLDETQVTPVPEEARQPTPTPDPSYPTKSILKLEEAKATPKTVVKQEVTTITSGGDKDCPDFSSHEEAQAYFLSKGGSPSNNVDRLDRDRDGLACED